MRKLNPLSFAVLLLAGCLNQSNIAGESRVDNAPTSAPTPTCTIPADAFKNLPTDVLIGTDIATFDTFQRANAAGHHFQTDTGGSQLDLFLQQGKSPSEARRSYKEPGAKDMTARFNNLCIGNGYIYGATVRGMFTKNGILWLELQSNNEFITPDLWFYMEKIN